MNGNHPIVRTVSVTATAFMGQSNAAELVQSEDRRIGERANANIDSVGEHRLLWAWGHVIW